MFYKRFYLFVSYGYVSNILDGTTASPYLNNKRAKGPSLLQEGEGSSQPQLMHCHIVYLLALHHLDLHKIYVNTFCWHVSLRYKRDIKCFILWYVILG